MLILAAADAPFSLVDWLVVALYLLIVLTIGTLASRRARAGGDDLFLAGRGMPMLAVAVSVFATALSAATFIGGPQLAYLGDLTYLSTNLGGLLAAVIIATVFIPAYYRRGVTSIYELLGDAFGPSARRAASGMFMIGRVFASGARLFLVAMPFSLIVFDSIDPPELITSIGIVAAVATLYTIAGGIRAVIWTDVLQAVIVISTVTTAAALLWHRIGLGPAELMDALRSASDDAASNSASKLRLISLDTDPSQPFTLWTALIGFTLFSIAAYGTDQDLTQRMLTCRSARSGAWSVIVSQVIGLPVVLLFLTMGLLLWVYHHQPDVVANAPQYVPDDSRTVFLDFILHEMPTGLKGLMVAGLFAAAMSSTDSALNAMASTTIADFYRPWAQHMRPALDETTTRKRDARAGRIAMLIWALALAGFACICVIWQRSDATRLLTFALDVMTFAYSGLLGVFGTALLTRTRGSATSAIAALIVGFGAVLLMQPGIWQRWTAPLGLTFTLAFPWRLTIAATLAFLTCAAARRHAT